MSSCGPASEEFALLTLDNILCAGAQFRGEQRKTSLQFSAQMMVEVLEYKMLTMQKLLAPCDISGVASLQPKPKVSVNWAASQENLYFEFLTMSDTNRAVHQQKMAIGLKLPI